MEHQWVLAQKELDQEKALHTKLHEESQKEYEHIIKEEKIKHERTVQGNENRLADLRKAHVEQCEELGREALKSNLEADRLHSELAARGMDIPRRLLFNKDNNQVNGGILSCLLRSLVFYLSILSSIVSCHLTSTIYYLICSFGYNTRGQSIYMNLYSTLTAIMVFVLIHSSFYRDIFF